jgi:hypothetical protein
VSGSTARVQECRRTAAGNAVQSGATAALHASAPVSTTRETVPHGGIPSSATAPAASAGVTGASLTAAAILLAECSASPSAAWTAILFPRVRNDHRGTAAAEIAEHLDGRGEKPLVPFAQSIRVVPRNVHASAQ